MEMGGGGPCLWAHLSPASGSGSLTPPQLFGTLSSLGAAPAPGANTV